MGEEGRGRQEKRGDGRGEGPGLGTNTFFTGPFPAVHFLEEPTALSLPRLPLPNPATAEVLLTPSDNTQHHAHFHKYKTSRVGQRGQTEVELQLCPSPQHPCPGSPCSYTPPTPSVSGSNLRFPPALKIVPPASPVPLATSFRIGYSVRSLEG